MNWKERLLNPRKICKPIPFWSLNDLLEEEELARQIGEMAEAGLGGSFLHARAGLKTAYMSARWMQIVDLCIKEGEKHGTATWLYDEEGFPSGFAGGAIPKKGAAYQMKWLECGELGEVPCSYSERTLGSYWINPDSKSFGKIEPGEDTAFYVQGSIVVHIAWNTDGLYADNLDENTVKAFIEYTHKAYGVRFGEEIGSNVPGIFTDEPTFCKQALPWSAVLPATFRERHGYELVPVLPALYYDLTGSSKVRYDYWETVSYLFITAYSKQISEWCSNNGLIHTGHVDNEETLVSQLRSNGGVMAFYRYMQIPGIDWLGRGIGDPVTPKQVASVASQLGKKHVLSEMFACSGWNVSFEELKGIAEWQYVMGITVMCPHLQLYSARGSRKNDYPPSLFYQQPWWKEYKLINEYFARLGTVLSEGKRICNVLLLHPIRSVWALYSPLYDNGVAEMDRAFAEISRWLMELHVDFDYGDEGIIADFGCVEGSNLIIGEAAYRTIIVPPVASLDARTVELLKAFAEGGGEVVSLGRFADRIEGNEAKEELILLFGKVISTVPVKAELERLLSTSHPEGLRITDDYGQEIGGIYCQIRETAPGERVLFAVNLDWNRGYTANITISGEWMVERMWLETAGLIRIPTSYHKGTTTIRLGFEPYQSCMLVWTGKEGDEESVGEASADKEKTGEKPAGKESSGNNPVPCREIKLLKAETIKLSGEWGLQREGDNSLTLDYARLSVEGETWTEKMPVADIFEILLKMGKPVKASLLFDFEVDCVPDGIERAYLGLEDPGQYRVSINGAELEAEMDSKQWFRDKSIKLLDIRTLIQQGNNQVRMDVDFSCSEKVYRLMENEEIPSTEFNKLTFDMELTSIYIIGSFHVYSKTPFLSEERNAVITAGPFAIFGETAKVNAENLTEQGLVFYAGNARLTRKVELEELEPGQRAVLELVKKPYAVLTKIWVNGKKAADMCWAPYEAEITDLIHSGQNEITIELFGSCRNLFGPHHHISGEAYFVGPSSFTRRKGFAERYIPGEEIWRDSYCFVKFGLAAEPRILLMGEGSFSTNFSVNDEQD